MIETILWILLSIFGALVLVLAVTLAMLDRYGK